MDEDSVIIQNEDSGLYAVEDLNNIEVLDVSENIDVAETVETVPINIQPDENINLDEAFAPLGETNESLRHVLLNGREEPNQHTINAITGLETRLETIEALDQIYSSGENVAHYYMWDDGNPNEEDRCGYFVAFVQGSDHIVQGANKVVGVTISNVEAGFIGNEDVPNRGSNYGLVCTNGKVKVRALTGIVAGDKVLPDVGGLAKVSFNNYGYEVISISNDNGINYVTICLAPQTSDLYLLQESISDVEDRLDIDENNITVAINTANAALLNSTNTDTQVNERYVQMGQQIASAIETANNAGVVAGNAQAAAILAQEIANATNVEINTIQQQVTEDIGEAVTSLNQLIEDVEPLTTWDGTNGVVGASYLIDHIQNDLATKTEVNTVDTRVDDAYTAIQTNAKGLQSVALIERKYSVGPHSPSYRLSYVDAQDLIPEGMVYAPTETEIVEQTSDGEYTFSFFAGNSYIWDGTNWIEHVDNVSFSASYILGNTNIIYWYTGQTDVTYENTIYPAQSLCLWVEDKWIVVAGLKENSYAHVASKVYQTAEQLSASIVSAQGDMVAIDARLDDNESAITQLTTRQGEHGTAITSLQSVSSNNAAYIENIALYTGADLVQILELNESPIGVFYPSAPTWDDTNCIWEFTGEGTDAPTSPCYAPNPNDSTQYYQYTCGTYNIWFRNTREYSATMAAIEQRVDVNEANIALVVSNVDGNNVINAASIVAAVNDAGSSVCINADHIDLSGGTVDVTAQEFTIKATDPNDNTKNLFIFNADNCKIGGWTIDENHLYSGAGVSYVSLDSNASDTYAIWAGGETASSAPFRVNRNGEIYASKGQFGPITVNANGAITWGAGSNLPNSGISSSTARTIITQELVSSPNIAGGKFCNLSQTTWIEVGKDANYVDNDAYGFGVYAGADPKGIFTIYNGDFGYVTLSGKLGVDFLKLDAGTSTVKPLGNWDFGDADSVTGITAVFG